MTTRLQNLVTIPEIEAASAALADVTVRTPLLSAPWLSQELGAEVRLKCENLQRAGSFKIRGAYTMLARLPDAQRRRGVITYSSGNHGQALALAAQLFHTKAVVVMPTTAPNVKVEGARRLGAEVVLVGTTSTERQARALELAEERGYVVVPPFDHPHIISGQATVGLEILQDWPGVRAVLVPVGGGGLLSGVGACIKQLRPDCLVIGVEPENADAMYRSRAAGHPVTIEAKPTVADGLMPVRPGDLTYAHTAEFIDDIVRVPDDAIVDATRALLQTGKLVVEFSGAATVAALRSGRFSPAGKATVVVLSGGNLDPQRALSLFSA